MSFEKEPDPWLKGPTPINEEFEQGICEALDQEGLSYEVLRGLRYERYGHIDVMIAHPDPPPGIGSWTLLHTMEEVDAFFKGWRLCKILHGIKPMTCTE